MGTLGPHPRLIRLLSGPRMDVRLHCPVTFTRLPAICQVSVPRSVPVYPGVANVWVRSTSLPITLQGTTMLLRWVPVSSACSSLGPEWAPSLLWVHADSHLTSAVLKKSQDWALHFKEVLQDTLGRQGRPQDLLLFAAGSRELGGTQAAAYSLRQCSSL